MKSNKAFFSWLIWYNFTSFISVSGSLLLVKTGSLLSQDFYSLKQKNHMNDMRKEMHHQQNHEVDEWKNALILKARVPTLSPMTGDLLGETAFFHCFVCFFLLGERVWVRE